MTNPHVFTKPTPEEAKAECDASTALFAVQRSCFWQLRKQWGTSKGGSIAWQLTFIGRPGHKKYAQSLEALRGYSAPELASFRRAVGHAIATARNPESKKHAVAVSFELDKIGTPYDAETGEIPNDDEITIQ